MNVLLTGNKDGSVVCWSTKNLNNEPSAADGLIALFRFELSSASSSGNKEDSSNSSGSASQVSLPDLIAKQIQSLCFRPLRINGKYRFVLTDLFYLNMFVQVVDIFDACWHPAFLFMFFFQPFLPPFLSFLRSTLPSSVFLLSSFYYSLSSFPSFFVQLFLPLLSSFYHFFPSFLPSLPPS